MALAMKAATYDECYRDIVAIWCDEGGKSLDDIALMPEGGRPGREAIADGS